MKSTVLVTYFNAYSTYIWQILTFSLDTTGHEMDIEEG